MDLFKEYTLLGMGDTAHVVARDVSIDTTLFPYTGRRNTAIHFVGSLSDFHIFKGFCTSQGYIGNYHYSSDLSTFSTRYAYRHNFSTPSYMEEYLSPISI